MAAPIAPQPIPYRAWLKHISGDFKPPVLGSRFDSGMCTSCRERLDVTEARSDHLPWTSSARNPGRSVSTRKPRILLSSSSTLAQIIAMSAMEPDVIHIFLAIEDVFLA